MQIFVTAVHVFLCFALIGVILLQPGKSDVAASFGGGAGNQGYGPRGQGHFLGRTTTVVAFMFMATSITLALYSTRSLQTGGSARDGIERVDVDDDGQGFGIQVPDAVLPPQDAPVELDGAAPTGAEGAPGEGTAGEGAAGEGASGEGAAGEGAAGEGAPVEGDDDVEVVPPAP